MMTKHLVPTAETEDQSLEWVRWRLDLLVKARESHSLSIDEAVEYGKLCHSEDRLLGVQPSNY